MEVTKAQQVESADAKLATALGAQKPADLSLASAMALENSAVMLDLDRVIELQPNFVYTYYNRGNLLYMNRDYRSAVADYTKAIELKGDFAEAYYNRGLAYLSLDEIAQGIKDLSKAGELGLYAAYNIIKRYSDVKE